ncbi:MAG: flagellar hook-basal body complex protein FliE [Alphaproteobacteria bacterium]
MDIAKLGNLPNLQGLRNAVGGATGSDDTNPAQGFASVLKNMVSQATSAQSEAQALSLAAARGDNVPLQDVVSAIGKAEMTLQTLVTVRDKAIEAYQEILRMPI